MWKVLFPLCLVIFVDVMGLCIVFPLFAPLFYDPTQGFLSAHTSLETRHLLYGSMLSVWPLYMLIASPLIGDLSDKIGRKKVLLLCLFGEGIAYLLGALSITTGSLIVFFLSRALAGIFSGSQPIAQAAIADLATADNKTRYMSYIVLAATLGVVLGPLIGGFMSDTAWVSWFNFATPFQVAALISLLNAVLLILTFKETHVVTKTVKIKLLKSISLLQDAFKQPAIRQLSVAFFLLQLSWSLYFQSLAYFLVANFQATTLSIGLFYGVIGLASALTLTYFMRLLLKTGQNDRHIFSLGLVCSVSGAVLASLFIHYLFIQYLAVALSAIGVSFAYTTGISLFSGKASAAHQGRMMGIAAALCGGAWTVTAGLTGVLLMGGAILPFIVAAICAALSFLFIRRLQDSASPSIQN